MFNRERTDNRVKILAVSALEVIAEGKADNPAFFANEMLNQIKRIYDDAQKEYAAEQEKAARMVF